MDETAQNDADFVGLAANIVGAYVSRNNVPTSELPALIAATHAALAKLGAPATIEVEKPTPPVPIRKTVTPEHIISLEDGKPYKMLKRHLAGCGLTPEQYRQKWGLPHDYPMVAVNYATYRSDLAKNSGLGQIRRDQAAARRAEAEMHAAESTPAPARRGRPKKAEAAE